MLAPWYSVACDEMVNLVPVNHHVQGWLVRLMFWSLCCSSLVCVCVELYQCDHFKGIGAAREHTHTHKHTFIPLTTNVFLHSNPVSQTLLAGCCEGCCRLLVLGWICTCYHMGRLRYLATKRFMPRKKRTSCSAKTNQVASPYQSYRAAKS